METHFQEIEEQIYRGKIEWVSYSELNIFKESPRLYEYRVLKGNRSAQSKNQRKGVALHYRVLEPEKFDWMVKPLVGVSDLRTLKAKHLTETLLNENPTAILLTEPDYEAVLQAAEAVRLHPEAAELLYKAQFEKSYFWEKIIKCKARADGLNLGLGSVFDLKSTESVPYFEKSIFEWGYHRQAAHYLEGAAQFDDFRNFKWIAVEFKEPFLCDVITASESLLEMGREENDELKSFFKECLEKNVWPVSSIRGPRVAHAPGWWRPKTEVVEMSL